MKFELKDFKGVIPAYVTPFDKDGNYYEKSAKEVINWLIGLGVGGFYLTGSNGFGAAMDSCERMKVCLEVMGMDAGYTPTLFGMMDTLAKEKFLSEMREIKAGTDVTCELFKAI